MASSPSRSTGQRVLFLGKPDAPVRAQLNALLIKHDFGLLDLAESAPASDEALHPLLSSSSFAILNLDTGPAALAWLGLFRRQCPDMPLIAVFEYIELDSLVATAPHGLDGALPLPVSNENLAQSLFTFIEKYKIKVAPITVSTQSTAAPFTATKGLLKATHLSPSSSSNQKILNKIDAHPNATRFIAHGPSGSEFTLLALEIANRRGWQEPDIHFGPGTPASSVRLVVVYSLETPAHCAPHQTILHCHSGETPAKQDDGTVVLSLLPLDQRLSDVAHYTARWLPVLATACLQPASPLPLPEHLRKILLTHSWPGQFSELWRTLEQIALVPSSDFLPENLKVADSSATFDELVQRNAARAFRAKIALRVPPGLLPTVLSALGYPSVPHE